MDKDNTTYYTEEPMEATVTYFFVDEDGAEGCSNYEPFRHNGMWLIPAPRNECCTELPPHTIERAFGIKLTYNDDPLIVYHR